MPMLGISQAAKLKLSIDPEIDPLPFYGMVLQKSVASGFIKAKVLHI